MRELSTNRAYLILITPCSPGEGGIFENKDTVHNEPLPDLNSTDAASMDFVEQEDHAESRGSPQEDDTVSWDAESRGSLHENDIDIEIHESNGESMDSESIIEGSRYEFMLA
jgi:hypothetical protein